MAEDNKDSAEKSYDASEHKLRKASEKGNIPLSNELNTFLTVIVYNLLFVLIVVFIKHIYSSLKPFICNLCEFEVSISGITKIMYYLFSSIVLVCLSISVCMSISSVVSTLVQTKLNVSAEKIKFKFSNISPQKGIKKIFSMRAITEFLKNIIKSAIFISIVYFIFKKYILSLDKYISLELLSQAQNAKEMIALILFLLCVVLMFIAITDFFIKKFFYMKQMKMSHKEMTDEHKENEGDPHIKAKLRKIRMQRSKERVAAAVQDSTFVVTNPTHYAIAIKYTLEQQTAPIITAKGMDFMAEAIKSVAKEHQIPIFENKPLARNLYASTEVGDEIPETEYIAVAEIIRNVLKL